MTVEEQVMRIKNDFDALHDKCISRHYVTSFAGDGTSTATFPVPFEPDFITVSCFEDANRTTATSLGMFMYDAREDGNLGGYATISTGSSYVLIMFGRPKIAEKYTYADGSVTIGGISMASKPVTALFGEGQTYTVVAVKSEVNE